MRIQNKTVILIMSQLQGKMIYFTTSFLESKTERIERMAFQEEPRLRMG